MTPLDAIDAKIAARKTLPPPRLRRMLREDLGLTQEDIAQVLDVHRETVARWERGEAYPSGKHLVAYVELLQRLKSQVAA